MPHPHSLRSELAQAIKEFQAAWADKRLGVAEFYLLIAALCRVVEPTMEGLGGDDAAFNQIVSDVEWAVETYVIPWDIPFLGAWAERFADTQAKSAVRPMLELMRPKFAGEVGLNEWKATAIAA